MSTADRREREFAAREKFILKIARQMVRESGFLNLQMAELARRSEYATGTLYHHFRCKEDILLLLAADGSRLRCELFERLIGWDASTRDRMAATGYADWLFVKNNPDHFRIEQLVKTIDIWDRATPGVRDELMTTGEGCASTVSGLIEQAVTEGDLDLGVRSARQVGFTFWSMSSGTHTITHAAGMLQRFEITDPYVTLARNYQCMLNALKWKPLQDAEDRSVLFAFFDRVHAEVFPDHAPVHRTIGEQALGEN